MKTIMPVLALLLVFYSLHSQQIIANDCSKLLKLCNKESFKIDFLAGPGQDVSELESVSCYRKPFPESNSVWLTWQIENPGNLEFSIIPFDEQDDFDFILFKANAEFNKCNDKMELRCMASGENIGDTHNTIRCLGITGLKQGASDKSRSQGCSTLEDNFLESISALKNEIYILFINNYSSNKGFIMEFGGNATFKHGEEGCLDIKTTSTFNQKNAKPIIGKLYPNPARQKLSVDIEVSNFTELDITIFNKIGQILYQDKGQLAKGKHKIDADISDFVPGTYFFKLRIDEEYYLYSFTKD